MNMVLGRIYLILICLISTSFLGRADEEAILLDRLLADYNNLSRPVRNKSDIVHVFIEMAVVKVIDLDVVQKFIVINALVKQTWMDWRLTWDPSKNSGIENLIVPSEKLWLPQVYVRNTMDTLEQPRVPRYFRLQSDGNLTSTAINQLKSHCHIDLEYFPFDRQICYPRLSSTLYYSNEVRLHLVHLGEVSSMLMKPNYEWDVRNISTNVTDHPSGITQQHISLASLRIDLQRLSQYYIMNVLVPTTIMFVLSFFTFWLPPDCGERLSLGVNLLVALSVFQLLVAEIIPTNLNHAPLLGTIIIIDMVVVSSTAGFTVLMIILQRKGTSGRPPGPWVRKFFRVRRSKTCRKNQVRSTKVDNPKRDGIFMHNGYENKVQAIAFESHSDPVTMETSIDADVPYPMTVRDQANCAAKSRQYCQQQVHIDQSRNATNERDEDEQVDVEAEWNQVVHRLDKIIFVFYLIGFGVYIAAMVPYVNTY